MSPTSLSFAVVGTLLGTHLAASNAEALPSGRLVPRASPSIAEVPLILGSKDNVTLVGGGGGAVIVLDYGSNFEGHPSFEVVSSTGDTSCFEITHGESRPFLDAFYHSDGPNYLAAAMDTYRVNRYNITGPQVVENRLIQGAFRYQKLNLSTPGELVLRNVGVRPTTHTTPVTELPGFFESSDPELNQIWRVAARTVQLNEIDANSIPDFWDVSPEGALVASSAPQVLGGLVAMSLTELQLSFQVKPLLGGFAFTVLADTLNMGIYCSYSVETNTITAYYGGTEVGSTVLASAILPESVAVNLGTWHAVNVTVKASTDIGISIDDVSVLSFSQFSSFFGSFGLGASFGQTAVFRNLEARSLDGSQVVFSHPLTDRSFLDLFMMGNNPLDTAVDGSKRDRITYAGDLDVALASTLSSTNGASYLRGTLDLIGSLQLTPGFFVPNAKIQQSPATVPIDANITGLIGYSFNLINAAAGFYMRTGDKDVAAQWAPRTQRMLDWAHSQVIDRGVFNLTEASFGGDWNYYDPPQSGVVGKFNMLYAYALQNTQALLADGGVDPAPYAARLEALRTAINDNLWSDQLGAYVISENLPAGFGQDTNALAVLAGVAAPDGDGARTAARVLSTLQQLSTPHGPLAFSSAAGFRTYISPFASAYHLRAALEARRGDLARALLAALWAPMADPAGALYSGCFWETLDATGAPALGRSTSLCHAWAAGPAGELSERVLGVAATAPGYREWVVRPLVLPGMTWARGAVPVPSGGAVTAAWNASADAVITELRVDGPAGSVGSVVLPTPVHDQVVVTINGQVAEEHDGVFKLP